MYLLQQQDLDGLIRLRALLEAGQHCVHQLPPVGGQDGHVVTRLVVELVGAAGAQDNLLCPPAAARNGEHVRGVMWRVVRLGRCGKEGGEVRDV